MMGADARTDFLLKAQETLEALFPGVLVIAGVAYPVSRSAEDASDRAARGGFEEDPDLAIRLRVALHPTQPRKGDLVELDGRPLRVGDVQRGAGDIAWHVELRRV
jgi:hypothetical protein